MTRWLGVGRQPLNFAALGLNPSRYGALHSLSVMTLKHSLIVWILYTPLTSEHETLNGS